MVCCIVLAKSVAKVEKMKLDKLDKMNETATVDTNLDKNDYRCADVDTYAYKRGVWWGVVGRTRRFGKCSRKMRRVRVFMSYEVENRK